MKETILTRKDDNLGEGLFDSIAWAFSEHVKLPDNPRYNSAILYGNDDAPEMIDFYAETELLVTSERLYRWTRPQPMKITVYTKQLRSGTRTDVEIREGTYNEYYLPALLDSQQEMWIIVTDEEGNETKIHLKR